MDERSLLLLLNDGSEEAFAAIFEKYYPKLHRFSLSLLHNKAVAEEIVQQSFMKVWENRTRIGQEGSFDSYLISIAKNSIINHLKHKAIEIKYERLATSINKESFSMEEKIYLEDIRVLLATGIEQLSEQQKKILSLKSLGYSNDEIASEMNLSKRTVESHINKAYNHLRTAFGDDLHMLQLFIPVIICFM